MVCVSQSTGVPSATHGIPSTRHGIHVYIYIPSTRKGIPSTKHYVLPKRLSPRLGSGKRKNLEDAHLSIVTPQQDDLVTQKAGCVGKQLKRVGMQMHIFILQHAPVVTHTA
jgi:hypothetical protein